MIYINGTGGRVGRYVYEFLAADMPVVRVSSSREEGVIYCDLSDPDLSFCDALFPGDFFIFLGARANPGACVDSEAAFKVNVQGTEAVIRKLLQKGVRVIFTSTIAVYGEGNGKFAEEAPLKGDTTYAKTKAYIEKCFAGEPDFKVLRLSFVLTPKSPVLEYFRGCLREGKVAEAYTGGVVSWVSVYDVAGVIREMLARWDEAPGVTNVCGLEPADKADLAGMYKEYVAPEFRYVAVAPPAEFAAGRTQNCPTSAERMIAFYGKNPLSLKDALILENTLSPHC